jgi:hypothetical protein
VIRSNSIELVDIESIKPRPDNRNIHSQEQIDRLCKIIEYQGFRDPLIVSNQSGLLVSGHGRLVAAKKLGLKKLPVTRQDFDTPDQEYAAMVSLNSIAAWSELDLSGISLDLPGMGEFDLDMLGIKDFKIETSDPLAQEEKPKEKKQIICQACGEIVNG